MKESFAEILAAGGKSNSLGRTNEVIEAVLKNQTRLAELYDCIHSDNAWVRMRAMDAMEKISRSHPGWIVPYIDRFQSELSSIDQPSIQWHLAQIYMQVPLTNDQKSITITWLKDKLSTVELDWIVAVNVMKSLVHFTKEGVVPKSDTISHLQLQRSHSSKTVVKKANTFISELVPTTT